MTVAELIKELSNFALNQEVWTTSERGESTIDVVELGTVLIEQGIHGNPFIKTEDQYKTVVLIY